MQIVLVPQVRKLYFDRTIKLYNFGWRHECCPNHLRFGRNPDVKQALWFVSRFLFVLYHMEKIQIISLCSHLIVPVYLSILIQCWNKCLIRMLRGKMYIIIWFCYLLLTWSHLFFPFFECYLKYSTFKNQNIGVFLFCKLVERLKKSLIRSVEITFSMTYFTDMYCNNYHQF